MRKFKLVIIFALFLSSCASVKFEKEQVQAVKRVAIVGFDVQQQRPVETGDLFKALTHQDTSSKAEIKGRTETPHVVKMYDILRAKFESQNHWQVLSQEMLRTNAGYQEYFKSKTDGWQNRPMINDRFTLMQPTGIVDSFAIYTTKPERLKQLQKELGVDALLVVGIRVELNNNSKFASLVGQGKFNPFAVTSLMLIDAEKNTKIWVDGSVKGDPVENNDKNFLGLANQDKLNQLAVLAAESSYGKLLASYKEKMSQ